MERGVAAMRPIDADAFDRRLAAAEGLLDQIRWERDVAIAQLESIGASLGEKMDGFHRVVTCKNCANQIESLAGGTVIRCATGRYHKPDWFCAGGEMRKDEPSP